MAGGATAVAGHYLLSSDWFFNTFTGPDGIEGGSKKIADEVQDLQGRSATEVTGWLNSGDVGEFGPNATLGDVTTVNLTTMSGGVQQNVVPNEFVIGFDIRITPTTNLREFEAMIQKWCDEVNVI